MSTKEYSGRGNCLHCDGTQVARGLCDKHYRRWKAHGDPLKTTRRPPDLDPVEVRFAKHFTPGAPDACWNWTGMISKAKDRPDYGVIKNGGRNEYAHRLAYRLSKAPIVNGDLIRHTCDNGLCVNPKHLLSGTPWDNMQDKIAHGDHLYGDRTPVAKLTEARVLMIRAGGKTDQEWAAQFGVSRPAVTMARNGTTWKRAGKKPRI